MIISKMESNICQVCFCPIEGFRYTCADSSCETDVCSDCINFFIGYCHDNNNIASCVNINCNAYYILSDLKTIKDLSKYYQSCFRYFIKENKEGINKKNEKKNMIIKLREQRIKFMSDNFPVAINLVASLAFQSKIRAIERAKKKMIDEKIKRLSINCFHTICTGYLDKNLECTSCMSKFCNKCEKELDKDHQCNQNDLDSIDLINNMSRCPKCNIPVFKDQGCDSITCANCGTNFAYKTGLAGGHGSSNRKVKITSETVRDLSVVYRDMLNEYDLTNLLKLESMKPTAVSKNILLKPIELYMKEDELNEMKYAKLLAKNIDLYTKSRYRLKEYLNDLTNIEKRIIAKDLIGSLLHRYLKKYK